MFICIIIIATCSYRLLLKYDARVESTNPEASTEAQVIRGQACIVMFSEPTSYQNRLIMEVMYIYEKTNINLMRDPIQEVDI